MSVSMKMLCARKAGADLLLLSSIDSKGIRMRMEQQDLAVWSDKPLSV
jgi:hypothetical protein